MKLILGNRTELALEWPARLTAGGLD